MGMIIKLHLENVGKHSKIFRFQFEYLEVGLDSATLDLLMFRLPDTIGQCLVKQMHLTSSICAKHLFVNCAVELYLTTCMHSNVCLYVSK
jgi:hypothetical protein